MERPPDRGSGGGSAALLGASRWALVGAGVVAGIGVMSGAGASWFCGGIIGDIVFPVIVGGKRLPNVGGCAGICPNT